jgi:hypothetical protein
MSSHISTAVLAKYSLAFCPLFILDSLISIMSNDCWTTSVNIDSALPFFSGDKTDDSNDIASLLSAAVTITSFAADDDDCDDDDDNLVVVVISS